MPQDYKKAVSLFKKAAEQGVEEAGCFLGQAYEEGTGVKVNMHKAEKWYKKAAEMGSEEALEKIKVLAH